MNKIGSQTALTNKVSDRACKDAHIACSRLCHRVNESAKYFFKGIYTLTSNSYSNACNFVNECRRLNTKMARPILIRKEEKFVSPALISSSAQREYQTIN